MPRRLRLAVAGVVAAVAVGGAALGLTVVLRHLAPAADTSATLTPPAPDVRSPSATGQPTGSLQALVDAAPAGARVVVPPALYRETVTISKPLTLEGDGAEIRGSDVFADWSADAGLWRSQASVPPLQQGGECANPTCQEPEQVFFDGRPLRWVTADPGPGAFTLDSTRRVLLGDDPAGHVVEVTTRAAWLIITASGVTVSGFTMHDAASAAQSGGVEADGADDLTLDHLTLDGAHGADLGIRGGADIHLKDLDLAGAGQLGLRIEDSTNVVVQDVRLHGNDTAGYDTSWEAGGMKALGVDGLQVTDSYAYGNNGPGLWCDGGCSNVTFSGNRVYGNSRAGIMVEISSGATISGNAVWENGWGFTTWGWGAGILVSSSAAVSVSGNTVAWNADGIAVISQNRGSAAWNDVHDVSVHDNTIVMAPQPGDGSDVMGLAWLQDWSGVLFAAGSHNGGSGNDYWWSGAVPRCGYEWNGCSASLSAFNATPGDEGGVAISSATKVARLSAAGIPAAPHGH